MTKRGLGQPLFDNKPGLTLFTGDLSFKPKPPKDPSHFVAPEIKSPTEEQQVRMEGLSSQMSSIQAAKAAGVEGYIPSATPDVAVEPERAKKIIIDRRKLGRLGKLAADQAPARVLKDLHDRL